MSKVTLSAELPLCPEVACALARTPELFAFVVAPIISAPRLDIPDRVEPGVEGAARIWWFGVIPAWRHHLRLVRLTDREIYTNEWGGPVRVWNHRLTFEPIDENRCRYTDEVEVQDGLPGFGVRVFVHLMFRHRQRRWRQLATLLAKSDIDIRPGRTTID
ncbi:hypothetical protein [Nocardia macrotermitis]|uniref:hypothetical protein n=1 Tax=Nocardia macrotermitis TaxID=2585198 RepID=UPI0029E826CD|nr:hypothetical protein [Nocardia macrotermitis]